MKKHDLSKWNFSEQLDCLLFFGQRVTEILFDYTLASFKFPTLYSTSLCKEAIRTIKMIENNELSKKSIIPIKEELTNRIYKDIVVREILGDMLSNYLKEFDIDNLTTYRTNLELLYNKIRPDIYINYTEKLLSKLIKENRKKEKINSLATNYITALIDFGYSQSYINLQANVFFFKRGDLPKIESPEVIDEFFKLFPLKEGKYDLIISASQLFKNIENALHDFNIFIHNERDNNLNKKEKQYFKNKGKDELLLKFNGIEALDALAAKEIAEIKLNTLSKLFTFFHHKEFPHFSKYALIYKDDKFQQAISPKTSAMQKGPDFYPNKAGEKLNTLIHNFGFERESFFKMDKAIELHGESIKSDSSESQLLQNWIAFETLLVGYSDKSKIEQVLEGIIPALKLTYLSTLLKELTSDLKYWNEKKTKEFLEPLTGEMLIEKVAQMICFENNKPIREKFYENLETFPLLKNRILKLKENLSTPKDALNLLLEHERRVIWQIKRIYRTRNQIVHLGYVPKYTSYLVENSHNYLDIFIKQIIHLVIQNLQIQSLEQGLKEIKINQKKHEILLEKNKESEYTEKNYKVLLFGEGTFANML